MAVVRRRCTQPGRRDGGDLSKQTFPVRRRDWQVRQAESTDTRTGLVPDPAGPGTAARTAGAVQQGGLLVMAAMTVLSLYAAAAPPAAGSREARLPVAAG